MAEVRRQCQDYREGIPRTILEALAMGRPVVTTDAPGCRETEVAGENGFLVAVRDVFSLAAALERRALTHSELASIAKVEDSKASLTMLNR